MTSKPVPPPADRLLKMLEASEIERQPLDAVKEQLHRRGVDCAVPERLRRLAGSMRDPVEGPLLSFEDDDPEGQPLPQVHAALDRRGVDCTAGMDRIRKVIGNPSVATPARAADGVRTAVFGQLDAMPWSGFHMTLLLTLAACWASVGLQAALLATFKASIASSLAVDRADLSAAIAMSLFGAVLGALAFGRLADRIGRRFAFSASLGLSALGAAFVPFCTSDPGSIAALNIVSLIAGIGTGGGCVAVNTTVQEFMPARVRGRACLAVNASFWLGPAFAALGAVWLANTSGSWETAYFASAALLCLVMLLLRNVPESPRWLVAKGRIEAAELIVSQIRQSLPAAKRAACAIAAPVAFDTGLGRRTLLEVGQIMCRDHWRTLLLCFAVMVCQAIFYNAVYFGYADALQKRLDANAHAGWHLLCIALGNFLGPVLLGPMVDVDSGRRRTMAFTFFAAGMLLTVTAASAALLGFSGQDGSIGAGSVAFTAALTLIFFFASAGTATAYLVSGEVFPLEIRALAFAVVFAASMGVGGVFSPVLFSWAVSTEEPHVIAGVYLVSALLLVAAAVAVAPVAWLRRLRRLWLTWQVSSRVLPDRSGKPLEAIPAI